MQVSKHISLIEATKSETAIRLGIANIPDAETFERMKLVAEQCFEKIREHFSVPIKVNSFYRSPELNKSIGGSKTSQHMTGEAIDMDAIEGTGITNADIFNWAKDNLIFDQLIWEYGDDKQPDWVHISYKKEGNRNQIIKIK